MRRNGVIVAITTIIIVAILCVAAYFGITWWNQTGVFAQPGALILDSSLTAPERSFIEETISDVELAKDVTISNQRVSERADSTADLLYNISVPVTDFYDPRSSITLAEAENAKNTAENTKDIKVISVLELTPQQKLLAIDDNYYLDTLTSGAFFDYLQITGEPEDAVKITTLLTAKLPKFPTQDEILTLAQTGVTALSRGMNAKLAQVKDPTYFAEKIAPFLSQFDLTHTSNEASFTPNANSNNICSKPEMINVLTAIGLDIVELTGNHNQDCSNDAAIQTIAKYNELGIKVFGGGVNAEAAAIPLEISEKNSGLTLLGYNLSTGGYTLGNTPGANFYTEEKAAADIAAAQARGDTVIVDVQYYECNGYDNAADSTVCDYANSAAGDQIGLFRHLIDLGADVVIGTSAHQPQTFELYGDGAIYYGLGNLFFDQSWWPGTTRSLILVHYFYDNQLVQTRIVPTVYDSTLQTRLMDTADAEQFIERLTKARPQNA